MLAGRPGPDAPPMRVILPIGPGSGVDTIVRAAQAALGRA
jgi:tripartite-type tricarboxylate transporter receptor subunit TctC